MRGGGHVGHGGHGGRGGGGGGRFNDRSNRGTSSGGYRGRKPESREQGVDMNNKTVAPFVEFAK